VFSVQEGWCSLRKATEPLRGENDQPEKAKSRAKLERRKPSSKRKSGQDGAEKQEVTKRD